MAKIVQYNIFGEAEPVEVAPRGYDAFIAKFKRKKTTDDCYTPQPVFDAVLNFVGTLTDLEGVEIVRPFWPGAERAAAERAAATELQLSPRELRIIAELDKQAGK